MNHIWQSDFSFLSSKLGHGSFLTFTALIILLSITVYPQNGDLEFTHLTAQDGLSMNRVTKILQDKRDFIWIGTINGLNLFDGYSFKLFMPDPSDSNSISTYAITDICEDKEGNIWIATPKGLNKYDWTTGKFSRYKHIPDDSSSLSNNVVLAVFVDDDDNLWVGTGDGLNLYNRNKNNFKVIKKVTELTNINSSQSVSAIGQDKDGNLWLGTWNGISVMNKNEKILNQYFSQPANTKHFNYRAISVIYKDRSGNMWIGTNGEGLKKFNVKSGKFSSYLSRSQNRSNLSSNYITSIYQDNLNNVWIGTLNGLEKYNQKKDNFARYVNNPRVSSSLLSNQVLSITQDKSGMVWIGTADGISRFYQTANKFHYYLHDPDHPENSITSNDVISVFIDKNNNVWAGSLNGLSEIVNQGKKIIHFKNIPGNPNSLSSNFVRTVLVDHEGKVWIGTNLNGLNEYNPETGKFKLYLNDIYDTSSISNNGITSICETRNGTLWFGTWWGLNKYDRKTGLFQRYFFKAGNPNGLQSNKILNIMEDSKGLIWVGTDGGGVSGINPNTNKFINFSSDSTNKYHISSNQVFMVFESKDGMIWFGTVHGLNRYNRKTGEIEIYSSADGLTGNLIDAIQEDNNGCLWIGTDKGLSKFDVKSNKIVNYTKRNGLKKLEFVQNVATKDKYGNLYFGADGILYFNPDSIEDDSLTSPVVFTGLKIYDKSVPISADGILKKSISDMKSISIPPGNDMITLEYSLLDYYDTKRNTFRYKLDGFDKTWNNVGSRNSAIYTNLPPGQYTFYVKATNNNGIGNEQEAKLRIIIVPTFFQTVWFKISLVILILLILSLVYEIRIRSIKKYNNTLERKVDERTKDLDRTIRELNLEIATKDKFFSIIAHDLRSPFIALLGFSNYLFDELDSLAKEEIKTISENIVKSAKLTFGLLENLLQWARIKTGRTIFEPEVVNLNKIVTDILSLFKSNADNKDIQLEIDVAKNISLFADVNMVQTILRNFISNSIKFTNNKGNIKITAIEESEYVKVSVIDNGVGIGGDKINKLFQIDQNVSSVGTNKEEGSGLGLILCKEFIELNHGRIFVKSELGKGTEFSFFLPKTEVLVVNDTPKNNSD